MSSSRSDRSQELIVENDPKSPVAEAYRSLRTNISFLSPDNPLQSLVISSSGPSEGKSLTVANLSISMAQNNQEVIVIDADLRKPMQHKFYGMTNYEGLSNVLTGELELEEALRETGIDGLRLITTGSIPPNPAELLGSKRMEEIIEEAEGNCDLLIVDTPPVIAVTDTAILATKVDGVLLVIASHEADQGMVAKAKENLDKVQANVVGAVLNKYPVGKSNGYYQYYYYYGGETVRG